jgi:hypothetical protein
VVLGREVIEKGAFADVGGIRNVLDGGAFKAALGEQVESGAEKALTNVRGTTLASIGRGRRLN